MYRRIFLIQIFFVGLMLAQNATEIVRRANELVLGKTSHGTSKMVVVRPDWKREVTMKTWSKGNDYYLILILSPAREKGQAFLKRKNEMWNWLPSIGRLIKLPPSMMMQSWMGSDFTNDDLLKESSIVDDYLHEIIGEEKISGYDCWQIKLIPKPDVAVVWGKIIIWISKKGYYMIKTEYYDETGELKNTQYGSEIKNIGGRTLPTVLTMVPADKEGYKTIFQILEIEFNKPIPKSFFSIKNIKRVR